MPLLLLLLLLLGLAMTHGWLRSAVLFLMTAYDDARVVVCASIARRFSLSAVSPAVWQKYTPHDVAFQALRVINGS